MEKLTITGRTKSIDVQKNIQQILVPVAACK